MSRDKGQAKGGPRLLLTDRDAAVYLERSNVHVEGGRVVYRIADDDYARSFNIPHVNVAVLFLGQGTSITQEAVRLLGEEHVHLAVTGAGGTPLHMGAMTTYAGTAHFRRLLPVYLDPALSLRAAVSIMKDRITLMFGLGADAARQHFRARETTGLQRACRAFQEKLTTCNDIPMLLGHEGQFSKACYAEFGRWAQLPGFRRAAGDAAEPTSGQDGADAARAVLANRLIDHGNYLCYGMAGAALWALGIPPHLSVFHGKTRAGGLVFDLADAFKDALVLPLAFHAAMQAPRSDDPEGAFRARMIGLFNDKRILASAIETVESMLRAAEAPGDA